MLYSFLDSLAEHVLAIDEHKLQISKEVVVTVSKHVFPLRTVATNSKVFLPRFMIFFKKIGLITHFSKIIDQ